MPPYGHSQSHEHAVQSSLEIIEFVLCSVHQLVIKETLHPLMSYFVNFSMVLLLSNRNVLFDVQIYPPDLFSL